MYISNFVDKGKQMAIDALLVSLLILFPHEGMLNDEYWQCIITGQSCRAAESSGRRSVKRFGRVSFTASRMGVPVPDKLCYLLRYLQRQWQIAGPRKLPTLAVPRTWYVFILRLILQVRSLHAVSGQGMSQTSLHWDFKSWSSCHPSRL